MTTAREAFVIAGTIRHPLDAPLLAMLVCNIEDHHTCILFLLPQLPLQFD
jgi:hypothetical protein